MAIDPVIAAFAGVDISNENAQLTRLAKALDHHESRRKNLVMSVAAADKSLASSEARTERLLRRLGGRGLKFAVGQSLDALLSAVGVESSAISRIGGNAIEALAVGNPAAAAAAIALGALREITSTVNDIKRERKEFEERIRKLKADIEKERFELNIVLLNVRNDMNYELRQAREKLSKDAADMQERAALALAEATLGGV